MWNMPIDKRTTSWLDGTFHSKFRELLLHAAARESVFCPAYCLMPDHFHLVWMGLRRESDQLNAAQFLRKQVNRLLAPRKLQSQAHDHVLREDERQRNAFSKTCFYILANPVRAELVERMEDWPFSGAVAPGFPTLHPFQADYWEMFWKIYVKVREAEPPAPPMPLLRGDAWPTPSQA